VSSAVFVVAAVLVGVRHEGGRPGQNSSRRTSVQTSVRAIRQHPFVWHVALLVVLSTATVLLVDCYFKWSVVRAVAPDRVGALVARYYLALNLASLLVQVLFGSAIVRRLGVAAGVVITPFLLLFGTLGALAGGGRLLPVLLMKGIDGSLRYSLHRITGELVYLPVPSRIRTRAKPLIDGALARATQSLASAGFLAASGGALLSPRVFAAVIAVLAATWLGVAVALRRPYLALLRDALSAGSLSTQESPDPLDLETAKVLVQHLASPDPLEVVGAIRALSRRASEGFVSALVLLHEDESVLTEALRIFGASPRTDWIPFARRLLADSREAVRIAAVRALAMHDPGEATRLENDPAPRVKAYCAVHLALRDARADVLEHPRIVELLRASIEQADAVRTGMLAAIADSPRLARLSALLAHLSATAGNSVEEVELFARAAAQQREERLIPRLIGLLSSRVGRDEVRVALVALGDAAYDEVSGRMPDPGLPRNLRLHLPKTLARFGTARAAECLLTSIETEADRLVRYKSIRALEVLVEGNPMRLDRLRVERLSRTNLVEHFQLQGVRAALDPSPCVVASTPAAKRLLVALLDEKASHALERAFRLLKIAHPRQQIRRAYLACVSGDAYARANAIELLDTLLRGSEQAVLRELFCLAADDLPTAERLRRAAQLIGDRAPHSSEDALVRLAGDGDLTVASLATLCAASLEQPELQRKLRGVLDQRADIDLSAGDPFATRTSRETVHA
jgi:AAA family ATP:ADP antiporter